MSIVYFNFRTRAGGFVRILFLLFFLILTTAYCVVIGHGLRYEILK